MPRLERDLTQGSVAGQLIRFSLPFLLANLVQSLYSVADMYIVGLFNDAASLSGVNIGGQITHLVSILTIGLAQGGTVLVAQYYGAKRMRDVSETIGTMFSFLMLLSVAITAVMLLLSRPLLQLINTPPESLPEALSYLRICLLGNVFIFGYNAISAVQRGMGDSKRPLVFVSIACALNVVLDLLLVGALRMGAAGAAIATILSQAVSMALAMLYLRRNDFAFDFRLQSFRIRWEKVRMIFRIGLPNSLQSVLVSTSFLVMTTLVNGFGVYASAAVGVVGKINSLAIMPASAMNMSISSMAAQNIGAGKHDRAMRALGIGILISLCIGALMFFVSWAFPDALISLFSDEAEVHRLGREYLRGFSFDYLAVPFAFCMTGLLIGAGHTTFSLLAGLLSSLIIRVPAAWLLARAGYGLMGIGLAAPIASLISALLSAWYILSGRWKRSVTGIGQAQHQAE